MTKKLTLVLLITFIFNQPLMAAPTLYFQNAGGLFSRDTLANGKTVVEQSFFGSFDLKPFSNGKSEVDKEIELQMGWNTWAHVYYWPSLALLVGGIVTSPSYSYTTLSSSDYSSRSTASMGMLLGSIVGLLLTANAALKSRRHMFRAINMINGMPANELSGASSGISGPVYSLGQLTFNF